MGPSISPAGRPERASFGLAAALAAAMSFAAAIAPTHAAAGEAWTWPVEGEIITPYRYGGDPFAAGQHRGIDIAAPVGEAVRAATAGTVTFAGTAGDSGLTVGVRTADGRFDTAYLHLDALDVGEGEGVAEGEEIGIVGTTGSRSAEAPHVHFGVRLSGEDRSYRDPMRFLATPGAPAPPVGAVPAPRVGPRPLAGPAPRRAPARSAVRAPRVAPSVSGAAAPAPGTGPQPLSPPARAPAFPDGPPRAARDAPGGGFDLGWAVACVGLAIAVGALMRPGLARRRATAAANGPVTSPPSKPAGRPAVR